MNASHVTVRELAAWGIDDNPYRPNSDAVTTALDHAGTFLATLTPFKQEDPRASHIPDEVASALATQSRRADLIEEMNGLDWTTGIVDLTRLVSFQRRIIPGEESLPIADDWSSLVAIAFGPVASIAYDVIERKGPVLTIQTENPNLQFRAGNTIETPLVLHGGSPFLEVAQYHGRWFLRDGYHRAYRLLHAGISHVPAVIIQAKTLAELGPVQPWFFNEETLGCVRPPLVTDFLNDTLTLTYTRPKLHKRLRVTMEETVEPATTQHLKEKTT
jgi:hypothetical protein